MLRSTRLVLCVLNLCLAPPLFAAEVQAAAILNVVDGELRGASGVLVGSTLWDVAFVDGTCAEAFSGCDDAASDFAFTDWSSASAAALVLLDQVFLDSPLGMFDSQPELTAGCERVDYCVANIPYSISHTPEYEGDIAFSGALNNSSEDRIAGGWLVQPADFGSHPGATWAVFSNPVPIPEPTTAVLLGLGLIGVGARRHRAR